MPGVVTFMVTSVALPLVLEPSMVKVIVIDNSEVIVMVSLPDDKLNRISSPSLASAMACLREPAPESLLFVTVMVAAKTLKDKIKK